jgi:hypothetical protein
MRVFLFISNGKDRFVQDQAGDRVGDDRSELEIKKPLPGIIDLHLIDILL